MNSDLAKISIYSSGTDDDFYFLDLSILEIPRLPLMGSSAKKKREKAKDFQKPKLKVGKARPKNTNATDTSFSAKSIVLKQQSVSESRDATALFNHNLSLLSSKSDTQRRDALQYLTMACQTAGNEGLPQSVPAILAKAQPLILDGSSSVRSQLLRLLKVLPLKDFGSVDRLLLHTRAGMTHLSTDIRQSSLDVLDWLLSTNATGVMACPGGWVKTLRTFQNLLGWHDGTTNVGAGGKWTSTGKPSTTLGSNKLLVHNLTTLSHLLTAGLTTPASDPDAAAKRAAERFPLWHTDTHLLPTKSNSFGYLNLFGTTRDVESEVYDDAEERVHVFNDLGMLAAFSDGVKEAKKEAGEVGRAAALVDKAIRLAEVG